MPVPTPVTTPVPDTTVVTASSLLLHVPPVVADVRAVVLPAQSVSVPPIAAGVATTVTVDIVRQPAAVYVIGVVPIDTPVTTPEVLLTVALVEKVTAHVPPVGVDANEALLPSHMPNEPVIDVGAAFTVTTLVEAHPVVAT